MTAYERIAYDLVELLSKHMGYSFSPDRISRIATEAMIINGGRASLLSLAVAFELDLLVYGEDLPPGVVLIGLHESPRV